MKNHEENSHQALEPPSLSLNKLLDSLNPAVFSSSVCSPQENRTAESDFGNRLWLLQRLKRDWPICSTAYKATVFQRRQSPGLSLTKCVIMSCLWGQWRLSKLKKFKSFQAFSRRGHDEEHMVLNFLQLIFSLARGQSLPTHTLPPPLEEKSFCCMSGEHEWTAPEIYVQLVCQSIINLTPLFLGTG